MQATAFQSLAAAFALCALAAAPTAYAQDASLSVQEPWVRASVPNQHATGAFMRLTSTAPARLVAVESPAARNVEIHEMAMQDNVMKMRQVAGIDLPAGHAVELKPGGYHVMLIDLVSQINAGQHVPLTLVIEDAQRQQRRITVDAEARPLGAAAKPAAGHAH